MAQEHYPDEVTKLDMVLALLQRTGKSETQTAVHAISVRLPTFDYANIEAMAQHSGISRNKMFCEIIGLGLSEIWSGLDAENAHIINDLRMRIYTEMVGPHLSGVSTLPQADQGEC